MNVKNQFMNSRKLIPLLLAMLIAMLALTGCGQTTTPTTAPAATEAVPVSDAPAIETGPVSIVGEVNSKNVAVVPSIYPDPSVVLIDVSDLIMGQSDIMIDDASQILGALITPMFPLPGQYRIDLPIQPRAASVDLDNNGTEDEGVQIFSLVVASNIIGNSYLQQLEQDGAPRSYLLDIVTGEITEGSFLVYAPDDLQGFPTGFGDDGKWFTADDPTMNLTKGYSVATLGADGSVTFDRSAEAVINTVERAEVAALDFSKQGIAESFNSLIDTLKVRYAYTELRQLDWEQIRDEYLPKVEEADASQDIAAYFLVVDQLAKSIHDAHVAANPGVNVDAIVAQGTAFGGQIDGNMGASAIAITDPQLPNAAPGDTIIVLTVGEDGPARQAGWVPGTEIISIDGQPAVDRIYDTPVLLSTGTDESRRALQMPLLLKFPIDQKVTFEYRLPDSDEVLSATMTTGSYDTGETTPPSEFAAPVTYEQVGNNYAVIRWGDFVDAILAKIAVLEEALAQEVGNPSAGVILDLRGNGGGWVVLYETMASYFFSADEPMPANMFDWYYFDQNADGLIRNFPQERQLSAPRPELAYTGPLVVLIDEGCASACEYFTQHLQLLDRATVIAQYGSKGAGGPIDRIALPSNGIFFQYTVGRTTFAGSDEFNLEAKGVVPDIRVSVTLESELAKLRGEDPVMQAAIAELDRVISEAATE